MAETTASQFAHAFAEFLNRHADRLPFGTEVAEVQVLSGSERKSARKRRPSADKRSASGDSLFIVLRPRSIAVGSARHGNDAQDANAAEAAAFQDAVVALHEAERTPGHSFVALKWFRDTYLVRKGFAWAQSLEGRDQVLRALTSRGWMRIDKIPNPRNPGFDTSALRLELAVPEVQALLGQPAPTLGWDFTPIKISGEPMSQTVRRMRDERG